jgi:predicted negative regulator of RcsB-dependent stress response
MMLNREQTLWQRYGKLFLLSVLLVMLVVAGFQYLSFQKTRKSEQASLVYEKMLTEVRKNNFDKTAEQASILIQDYPETPYGALGALMLSRISIDKNNFDQAEEQLRTAIKLSQKTPVEHVARVRLARVLTGKEKYQEALEVLPTSESKEKAYITLYEEMRGDIYLKQNEIQKAKEAYAKALAAAPQGVALNALQLKYTDLN